MSKLIMKENNEVYLDLENYSYDDLAYILLIIFNSMEFRLMNDCLQVKGKHNDKWYFVREFDLRKERKQHELLRRILDND